MKLEDCKKPYEYRKYARDNELTVEEIQLCLDKQEDESDYYWFAIEVRGLTFEQKDFCKNKIKMLTMGHVVDIRDVSKLTDEHIDRWQLELIGELPREKRIIYLSKEKDRYIAKVSISESSLEIHTFDTDTNVNEIMKDYLDIGYSMKLE